MVIASRIGFTLTALVALCSCFGTTASAQVGLSSSGGISRPFAAQPPGGQAGWVKGHNAMTRLIAGALPAAAGGRQLVAGLELRLDDGWKTYWRYPGDDGGLPPSFDWSGSRNLKSATVRFPAPQRLKSLNGTTLGYSKAVVLPVEIEPADPARPVELSLALEYGICREICIPAEAKLTVTIDTRLAAMPPELAAALTKVPRRIGSDEAVRILKSAKATLSGPSPSIVFDVAAAGAAIDLFVEAPAGTYLPVPAKAGGAAAGQQRFRIDLKGVEDIARLAGKELVLTVAGPTGGVELGWVVR